MKDYPLPPTGPSHLCRIIEQDSNFGFAEIKENLSLIALQPLHERCYDKSNLAPNIKIQIRKDNINNKCASHPLTPIVFLNYFPIQPEEFSILLVENSINNFSGNLIGTQEYINNERKS